MMIPQDQELLEQIVGLVATHTKGHDHSPTAFPTIVPTPLPEVKYEVSSDVGHKTLWVVCVVMGLSSLAFYMMALRVPVQKRLFHVLTALITTFAFLSYYAMATGSGIALHTTVLHATKQGVVTNVVKRAVYWARYVDWTLTTPLLLLDLALLAGLNGADMLVIVISDLIMVLTGLFAAFANDAPQGWGWYAFACIAYVNIVYQVGLKGRHAVVGKDTKTKAFFGAISLFTLVLWTLYPIVWGVADGSRIVGVDGEIIAYAVLDILAKPVFGFWLLLTHDALARASPSLEGFWSNGLSAEGTLRVGNGQDDD